MIFHMSFTEEQKAKILYILKILACALIVTLLAICIDKDHVSNFFLWSSLTAFFTIQYDANSPVNFNQVTGNLIGSSIGVIIWLLVSQFSKEHTYINIEYLLLIVGILLTTITCILLKHAEYCGIALSGLLIVTVYDVSHNTFHGALLRILFCAIGCLIAYIVDKLSHKILKNHIYNKA